MPFNINPEMFNGKKIRLYTLNTKPPHPPNYKIAQLRMYVKGLTETDLVNLMGLTKWPGGKVAQQCSSPVSEPPYLSPLRHETGRLF